MVTPDGWGRDQRVLGHWMVTSMSEGPYDITLTFARPADGPGTARILFGQASETAAVEKGAEQVRFTGVALQPGDGTFEATLQIGSEVVGAWQVEVARR